MPFHRPIPDQQPRGKASSLVDSIVQAEKLIQVALVLPCAAFIGWLAGAWLDSRLHQSWLSMAGIVLGIISGLVSAIRLAMRMTSKVEDEGSHDQKGNHA